jgi:adenylate cyclase
VLVSAATLAGTPEQRVRDVGTFLLRGKRLPVRVYEPLAAARVHSDEPTLEQFAAALDAFRRGEWRRSGQQFAELVARCPDDGPSAYYLALAAQYERDAPSGWAGAVQVTVK